MATPLWPLNLQRYQLPFDIERQETRLISDVDAGPPKVRRRFTAATEIFDFNWNCDEEQRARIEEFFQVDTEEGTAQFNFPDPRTGTNVLCRFGEAPRYTMIAGGFGQRWRVRFTIEVLPT